MQKNESELSTQVLELQQKIDDSESELERQIELNKMTERQLEELRSHSQKMESQVEISLS